MCASNWVFVARLLQSNIFVHRKIDRKNRKEKLNKLKSFFVNKICDNESDKKIFGRFFRFKVIDWIILIWLHRRNEWKQFFSFHADIPHRLRNSPTKTHPTDYCFLFFCFTNLFNVLLKIKTFSLSFPLFFEMKLVTF